MSIKKELVDAVTLLREHCHGRKCFRGEPCEFYVPSENGAYRVCKLEYAPCYWSIKKQKSRKEVFLKVFQDARCKLRGEPTTCVNNVFGTIEVDCCTKGIHCDECWDKPAPTKYQED